MKQQESVQQQISEMLTNAPPPMNAMAELTRQNMEMWSRMQEGMLAFMRAPRPARSPGNAEESSGLDQAVPTVKATKNSP
jgi:polyhydroxyalkanoate synthesis regulator protein